MPIKSKAAPKAGAKKKPVDKPLGPSVGGGVAAYSLSDPLGLRKADGDEGVKELSATGIEDMLEALELVNQKTDKDAMGAKVRYSEAARLTFRRD
jgi:hypothetical protein